MEEENKAFIEIPEITSRNVSIMELYITQDTPTTDIVFIVPNANSFYIFLIYLLLN